MRAKRTKSKAKRLLLPEGSFIEIGSALFIVNYVCAFLSKRQRKMLLQALNSLATGGGLGRPLPGGPP